MCHLKEKNTSPCKMMQKLEAVVDKIIMLLQTGCIWVHQIMNFAQKMVIGSSSKVYFGINER